MHRTADYAKLDHERIEGILHELNMEQILEYITGRNMLTEFPNQGPLRQFSSARQIGKNHWDAL